MHTSGYQFRHLINETDPSDLSALFFKEKSSLKMKNRYYGFSRGLVSMTSTVSDAEYGFDE